MNQKIQYTIRNLTPQLDNLLRQRARELHKSLNEVVLDAVSSGVGLGDQALVYHDMDALIGSWEEDLEFEAALEIQDQIDHKLWS
ncbi:MAG: hypothetical protein HYS07_08125 [Chlamydiae bacterium]|nr:hypothetical protein [Chlamydiota bacterium]